MDNQLKKKFDDDYKDFLEYADEGDVYEADCNLLDSLNYPEEFGSFLVINDSGKIFERPSNTHDASYLTESGWPHVVSEEDYEIIFHKKPE